MNNKIFSLISGASTLNRAVWRITYLNPLFSLENSLISERINHYLKNIIKYKNLKNFQKNKYNIFKALMKWRNNIKSNNSFDIIKNINKGLYCFIKIMKLKYLKEILENWNNKIKDSDDFNKKLSVLFNNFNNPDNIKNTLFLYYKNLINCLKNFNNQKITTYKTIDNFCKYLTDFKNHMKKKDKVLMLNEIINKEILRSKRLLLKLKFCNWIKNGKIISDKILDD